MFKFLKKNKVDKYETLNNDKNEFKTDSPDEEESQLKIISTDHEASKVKKEKTPFQKKIERYADPYPELGRPDSGHIVTDPEGSWTGVPVDSRDSGPVQDVDDL